MRYMWRYAYHVFSLCTALTKMTIISLTSCFTILPILWLTDVSVGSSWQHVADELVYAYGMHAQTFTNICLWSHVQLQIMTLQPVE